MAKLNPIFKAMVGPNADHGRYARNDAYWNERLERIKNAPRKNTEDWFIWRKWRNEEIQRILSKKWAKIPPHKRTIRRYQKIIEAVKNGVNNTTQFTGNYQNRKESKYVDGAGPVGGDGGDIDNTQIYIGVPSFVAQNATLTSNAGFQPWPWDPRYHKYTAPAEWPSAESAGNYFVDNSHLSATDTDNTYGYPDKPRLTPPIFNDLPAGTIVEFGGGTITAQSILRVAGTPQNPVWIRGSTGLTPANMPQVTGHIKMEGCSYVFVEGLRWADGQSDSIFSFTNDNGLSGDTHHCVFRNNYYINHDNINSKAMVIVSASDLNGPEAPINPGTITSDIVVYNNVLQGEFEQPNWATSDYDAHSIAITTRYQENLGANERVHTTRVWAIDNDIRYCSGNGIQLISIDVRLKDWRDRVNYIWSAGNLGGFCRQAGLWTKRSSHAIFSQNIIDTALDDYNSSNGQAAGNQYGPDNVWWIGNRVFNCHYGIQQTDTNLVGTVGKTYYVGNIVHDTYNMLSTDPIFYLQDEGSFRDGTAFSFTSNDQQNRFLVLNTAYNCTNAIVGTMIAANNGDTYAANNVWMLADGSSGDVGHDTGEFYQTGSLPALQVNNDICYRLDGSWSSLYDGSTYSSPAALNAVAGFDNIQDSNPQLTNPAAQDFTPSPGSPCIGNGGYSTPDGTNLRATFQSLYGLDIAYDYIGTTRSITSPDIGASEAY